MRSYFPIAAALLLACSGARAHTQSPEAPTPPSGISSLRINTRLVVLDVVVLDKAGRPAGNLDRSQFTVKEDGVPQQIRNFDPPANHRMPSGGSTVPIVRSSADLAKIGAAPVNILVFDELNTRWEGTVYARGQMEKYLRSQPEVLPVPTLLLAAGDARFAVLQDYTQSRADLLEAIHKHFPQYPWQMMRGGSNSSIDLLEQTLGALSQIAESARGAPGRKNVIWVGSGYPSLDLTTLQADDEGKLMDLIRRVTDRMLRARITLYMVDPLGVQTGSGATGSGDGDAALETGIVNLTGPYHGQLDFSTFAASTGGEVFANRNDTDAAIGQGIQDGGMYYTLAYVPARASDQGHDYRHIRITLNDPSLHVLTRDGYFGGEAPVDPIPTGGAKPVNQLQFDIVSAARTRLSYTAIPVSPASTTNGFVLTVGVMPLQWKDAEDGRRTAELTVMTVCFNAKDKKLLSKTMELKERIGGDTPLNPASAIKLSLPIQAPQGTSRVRFVVRDASSGLLGTADFKP